MPPSSPADPPRVLIVADDVDIGRTAAARLGPTFAAGVRGCRPEQAESEADAHRADVIVLALAALDDVQRHALALQLPGSDAPRPPVLALCDTAACAAAAALVVDALIDDYVQHFPTPADPGRLAASVRVLARIGAAPPSGAPAAAAPPRRRPIVLVVEDDEVLHTLVAAMLEPEHLDVVFEADGAAALERIHAVGPDLVLMDVMLPGGDGVALTEQIKASPDLAAIPVVMLTGEAKLDTLVRSMAAGAADFIVKPFTRESLVAKLTKYLPMPA